MIVVIGCGKRKQAVPKPAGDLYTGSLFRACKRYAEAQGARWAILSAEHGLVLPERELAPYDRKLGLRGAELQDWSREAAYQYVQAFGTEPCECLAGHPYAWPFRNALWWNHDVRCTEPLQGLELGQRLSWLKARYELKQAS